MKIKRENIFKLYLVDSLGKLFNLQKFLNNKKIFEKIKKNKKTNEYKKLKQKFDFIKNTNYNVIQIDEYYFTCIKIINIVRLLNEVDTWITLDPYDP